jgi:DNA invertase Pin-like site-specific DNA recombinase
MPNMKAFGYVRLSKEDAHSTSPARQRERIERLCADRGWELLETFEDIDLSAFNGKRRPGFEAMMGRLADVDAIVFWRLDRLSRSVGHFSRILEDTQAADVQLVSTDQPIDTSSAMGKAFVQISSVFAELEAGTTSERSRQMMAYKSDRGEWVGRVPFGWRLVGKHLEPDPDQQAILEQAARRYVAGESFSSIARDLGLGVAPMIRMLHSERVQEVLPPDLLGPLVSALTARRLVRVPTSSASLLGGLASCGVCGGAMVASSTRAGRSGRWRQYRCPVAGHVGISAPWLDAYVSEQVLAAVDTGKLLKAIRARKPKARTRKASELEARLELLEHDHYVTGKVPAARFSRLRDGLLEQLAEARRVEQQAGVAIPEELARNLGERWDTLSIEARRRFVSAVLERIEVAKSVGHGPVDPSRVDLRWRALT